MQLCLLARRAHFRYAMVGGLNVFIDPEHLKLPAANGGVCARRLVQSAQSIKAKYRLNRFLLCTRTDPGGCVAGDGFDQ